MIAAALCSCAFHSINMTFTKVTELSKINAVIMLYILITLVIQQLHCCTNTNQYTDNFC